MTQSLGVAVLGAGRMGEIHAHNLAGRVPRCHLAGVFDLEPARARALAERHDATTLPTALAAFEDPGVDAVVLATPAHTHPELIELAASHDTHVLCEKPLAYDLGAAQAAVSAAERAGIVLHVGFHRRFDRDHARVAQRLRRGELGALLQYRSEMRDEQPPPDAVLRTTSIFVESMCHDFDAARWMAGEIVELTAHGAGLTAPIYDEIEDPDNAVVVLRFASGALGVVGNSRVAGYGFDCRTELLGSAGAARIDRSRAADVEWLSPGAASGELTRDFYDRFHACYPPELEAFVGAVLDGAPSEAATGADGVAALRLCNAAIASYRERRTVELQASGSRT